MSTRVFHPENTADIDISYSTPASQGVTRKITWIKPDTEAYTMTALAVAFSTTYGGYDVRAYDGQGASIGQLASQTDGSGAYQFDLAGTVWAEVDTSEITITVRRPSSNRQIYHDLRIILTYQAKESPTPPAPAVPPFLPTHRDHTMRKDGIRVFSQWETEFPNSWDAMPIGEGFLTPKECRISEEAGGQYTLSMTHPIDPAGKWRLLTPFAIIAAPIPPTSTPFIDQSSNIVVGEGMEAWSASTDSTGFYTSKYATRYKGWKNGEGYYPGDRVTYQIWNWECVTITFLPPGEGGAWKKLGRSDSPRAVGTIPQGELFLVSEKETIGETEWLTITRLDGVTGYAKASECAYMYTPGAGDSLLDDIPARELTIGCFRIMDLTIDSKDNTVKVTAPHVSYDWSMAIANKIELKETPLVTAISAIRTAMLPSGTQSAPHIYPENTGYDITAKLNRKALTNIVLDPDEGLVSQAKARLVRDGYDFFLLRNEPGDQADRGYTIRYGVNLRGVTWRRDYSKLVTRVLPIAKDAEGKEYLLPATTDETWPYVDSDYRGTYPLDMYQTLTVDAQIGTGEGDDDMTEAEVQQKMVEEATKVFTEDEADKPDTTLTVEFLMLGETEEYRQYKGLERLTLYDRVTIEHPDLGLSTVSQVKSYEWDALNQRYLKITLGNVFEHPARTVYGYGIADGAISLRKLSPEAIESIRNG